MGKRVRSLSESEFVWACRELARRVAESGFFPDALVGIATGGARVAEKMHGVAPWDFTLYTQRATTSAKGSLFRKTISHLPCKVNNWLRIAESNAYGMMDKVRKPRIKHIELPSGLKDWLHANPEAGVLIVDDAADSGSTLASAVEAIRKAAPKATIRTAVITVTRPNPLITPDFTLYNDGMLIRFPWAADAQLKNSGIEVGGPPRVSIAIIDLDGTLIPFNTFTRFVKRMFFKGDGDLKWFLAKTVWKRKLRMITHSEAKRRIMHEVEKAISSHRLPTSVFKDYARMLAPHARKRVQACAKSAEISILATAAPSAYALPLAQMLGFDRVVATHTDGNECKGKAKLEAVLALGVKFDKDTVVITDSEDDRPLMEANSSGRNIIWR